jgi:hypothetical protein
VWAAGEIAASNGGSVMGWTGVRYPGLGYTSNMIGFHWDGGNGTVWMHVDGNGFLNQIVCNGNQFRVKDLDMNTAYMTWLDIDNSRWFANTFRSDPRFKRNIVKADDFDSLGALCRVPIMAFDWTYEGNPHVPYGVISTDMRRELPDTVVAALDADEVDSTDHIDTPALFTHLIHAIQQLDAKVRRLTGE